ncbi:mechanosensitive ion channel family protein, partial [Gemmatimonadota bacterium]
MTEFLATDWIQRIAFILGGLILGYLVERLFLRWIHRAAKWTEWEWDDVLADSLRWIPTIWITAGGVTIAMGIGEVDPLLLRTTGTFLTVVLIGSLIIAAMRGAGETVEKISARSSGALPSATLVTNLVRLGIGILGIFLILQNLDINITPLITALGIGGLAVALALQDTLGNLFAGIQIILSRQVRPDDYVRLASGEEGHVTDVKGRNTTIRTRPDGNLVVVPNSVLASSILKNYSLPEKSLWVSLIVGVSYDSDLEHVEKVTLEVAREVLEAADGGLAEEPVLRFREFADSSINFRVRMKVREFNDQFRIRHQFIKRLHARYG